jgi:hypothetical protein
MGGSRLIAWSIGLVVFALAIAVIAGETTFFRDFTRLTLDMPISEQLDVLAKEAKPIGWGVLSFAALLVLLWSKLR